LAKTLRLRRISRGQRQLGTPFWSKASSSNQGDAQRMRAKTLARSHRATRKCYLPR